ncbi:hypothetical protein [Reyranella sp.]|uniref:hypothetical protein n=1 Tax=Reyranella sp. TaxID=1929291 RepID=UPI003D0FDF21
MRLSWRDLGTARADKADGKRVEIVGFALPSQPRGAAEAFLLMAEPGCCVGCAPNNPSAVVEVFAERPLKTPTGALRVSGVWCVSAYTDGWRYQVREAEVARMVKRRTLMLRARSSVFRSRRWRRQRTVWRSIFTVTPAT